MIKNKPIKKNKKKLRTAALSVMLAVIVWFMVIYINDPDITTTVSNIDVRFVGEKVLRDKELALTGKNEIGTLSVVVTGKRSDLMDHMDDIYVQVDVGDIEKTGEYNLTGTISVPTARINVERENFGNIPIRVEKLTSKNIEVTVKQTGTLKNKLVQSVANSSEVTVTGAKSEIDNVGGATATVDISKLKEDTTEKVNYLLTDKNGALLDTNETIEVTRSYVEVSNTIFDVKTLPIVPVLTAELENDYILKTDKSVVSPTSVVVGVLPENTDDKVIARVDFLYEGNTGEYMLESTNDMYIPEESKKVKVKTETVKKVTEKIELSVEAENVPEGLTARIDDKLNALVWGEEGKINSENVKAVVDATGLEKGEYELPVALYGDNFGFAESYTINIKIE